MGGRNAAELRQSADPWKHSVIVQALIGGLFWWSLRQDITSLLPAKGHAKSEVVRIATALIGEVFGEFPD